VSHAQSPPSERERVGARIARIDWSRVQDGLDVAGHAVIPGLLDAALARSLVALWPHDRLFRKRIRMQQHDFGVGDYGYFGEPLPPIVDTLRAQLYEGLAPIASRERARLGDDSAFPATLPAYRRLCAQAGQTRPTPLLLRYERGGYNRLHRDLYGDVAFPFQVTVLLSRPQRDFRGGELVLVENTARKQARGRVVALARGDAVVFPVRERAIPGKRGYRRAEMRHGVSDVESGERFALGVIFHDAA
jgi:hypothetical protein